MTRIGLVRGLVLYFKIYILKQQYQIHTGFLKHPINLRKGTTDHLTFNQIFISRIYNLPLKFEPKYIIDCGANVGMASIYFASKYPQATIIAIEPEISNFRVLTENCKNYKNIYLLQKAVWHTSMNMEVVDTGSGNYGFAMKELSEVKVDSIKDVVTSITLGEVMKLYSIDRIDLLKIDIEGAEKEIFSVNYDDWLSKTKTLTVETHDRFNPGASRAIVKAIAKYDFSITGVHEGLYCELDV